MCCPLLYERLMSLSLCPRVLFLFGFEVIKFFFVCISNPSHSTNRLSRVLFLGKKFHNSLYKGFTVVNNIHNEIDSNKITAAYFKL